MQLLSIAMILYRWHVEDPAGCEAFIGDAYRLRAVYEAVVSA
jgi:hypothetical protein